MGMKYISVILFAMVLVIGCDNRTSTNNSSKASFRADVVAVKDSTGYGNVVDITFKREGVLFDNALIKVAGFAIPMIGNGRYRTAGISLRTGEFSATFSSTADNYGSTVYFEIPDTFLIQDITPSYNSGGNPVYVGWSQARAAEAVRYFISVVGKNYVDNETQPLSFNVGTFRYFTIPDTAFENSLGILEPDTYYVYVGAYTRGFMSYDGIPCPIPANLPKRTLVNPAGYMGYGEIAPRGLIIVPR